MFISGVCLHSERQKRAIIFIAAPALSTVLVAYFTQNCANHVYVVG